MKQVLFGLNLILLVVFWHFVVKKTLIDHTRDKLFDLRDRIRNDHIANGWGLDSGTYKNLRSLVNSYLRYTESYSVWKIVLLRVELSKSSNTELREYILNRFNAKFTPKSESHAKYIREVRRQAFEIITDFSVFGSGLMLLITLLCLPFLLVHELIALFKKGLVAALRMLIHDISHLSISLQKLWTLSSKRVASIFVDRISFDVAISDQDFASARP